MLLFPIISFIFLPFIFATNEFVKNVPDSRCTARGDFMVHPHDRCLYVVCEFDIGLGVFRKGKMFARVMRCAPGTVVPLKQYRHPRAVIKNSPCTQFYTGRCPASSSGSSYGTRSYDQRYSGKSLHRRQGYNNRIPRYDSTGLGNGKVMGNYENLAQLSITRNQRNSKQDKSHSNRGHSYRYRGRSHSHGNVRRGHENKKSKSHGLPHRPRYDEHRQKDAKSGFPYPSPYQSTSSGIGFKPDSRCKKVGQFLTHPHDHCKYLVCEFGRNRLHDVQKHSTGRMYAREMPCAPGTIVQSSKYSKSHLMAAPCTEFYSGHCPSQPGFSSASSSSHSKSNYRYY